jgi:hypothetical protein
MRSIEALREALDVRLKTIIVRFQEAFPELYKWMVEEKGITKLRAQSHYECFKAGFLLGILEERECGTCHTIDLGEDDPR